MLYNVAMNPTFVHEKMFWNKGKRFVAGADEVGRGAFAGPVVAAAVIFDPLNINWPEKVLIRDSKKMTQKQRLTALNWLKENTYWGIGEVGVGYINKYGIKKSAERAFRRALKEAQYHLPKRMDHLLVDAFFVPYAAGISRKRQTAIVKGDNISASIAAASIIAKCHRDEKMQELGRKKEFKAYKWAKNVGYGTEEHRNAITNLGVCRHHRRAFVHL